MLGIFLSAILARAVHGQTFGNEINTYGTVAFIRAGESTPWVRSGNQLLTAVGAQQMHELGSNFRGRYIDEESGATRLGVRPIAGMSQAQLDPNQLFIQTLNRPHLVASAQAFMQEEFLNTQAAERDFYQSLDLDWFGGDIPNRAMLDYSNAFSIHDALSYHYTHDKSTFDALTNSSTAGILSKARYLADQDAWYRYANISADDTLSPRAMAGQTLAALILGRFQQVIANHGNASNGLVNGNTQPLTLLFGDYAPILSFLSIAEVDYQQHTQKWHSLPDPGSALVFELFTRGQAKADTEDDMWGGGLVRGVYIV
ncbi:hypothetical protein GRF29_106g400444 [Pseudopithomyces chartarum]|uniref:Uncharacterized protein n=1 Tax=Pseudopithomyces chartarum TaxID=1892770 RepID=A0AAN6LSZ7_9PLEO|nr:hypothetical protein GRF29_106g400444 [Pseudopithomyces chartarum]